MEQGIDVSSYQPTIDWPAVKAAGIGHAYCKASEGVTYADPTYFAHMNNARQAGICPGAYHFYRPNDDPRMQAAWFLKAAGWNSDWLPHALDIEVRGRESDADFVRGITLWLEVVNMAIGKPAVIYVDPSFWRELGDPKDFRPHPLWIADYGVETPDLPGGWPDYAMWQYTSSGRVGGIGTDVDLSWVKPGAWSEVGTAV